MAESVSTEGILDWIEERRERFTAIADDIWRHPQTALTEDYACALQADAMEADGFTVTRNAGGLPTAFVAEWGSGSPIIGFLGEYDALPGLSQKLQATQDPITEGTPGHGCGHNLLGTGALAATMAMKAWMQETGQAGTIRYYGCPAEETIAGKVYMARAGVFDDLDASITWHPGGMSSVTKGSSLAVNNLKFRFHGKTAHAAAQPHMGRSALDAVELMNSGVNYMREHIIEQARIHYVITNGGGAPNVVPDEAEVWYFIRAPQRDQVEELTARIRKIAEGATLMTETTVEERFEAGAYNILPNDVLADLTQQILEDLGPMSFTDEEQDFAQTIVNGYPAGTIEAGMRGANRPMSLLTKPLVADPQPVNDEGKAMPGSTDVGDVSWITPTVMTWATCAPAGIPGHSWGIVAAGGMSIGHKGMLHAAKTMALTAVELFTNPDTLKQAQDEFKQRTGGKPYKSPIPEGVEPPLP